MYFFTPYEIVDFRHCSAGVSVKLLAQIYIAVHIVYNGALYILLVIELKTVNYVLLCVY